MRILVGIRIDAQLDLLLGIFVVVRPLHKIEEHYVAKKTKKAVKATKKPVRREYTEADVKGATCSFESEDAGG
jgi:hypothetical protein